MNDAIKVVINESPPENLLFFGVDSVNSMNNCWFF